MADELAVPTAANTIAEIKAYLEAKGITFKSNDSKDTLLAMAVSGVGDNDAPSSAIDATSATSEESTSASATSEESGESAEPAAAEQPEPDSNLDTDPINPPLLSYTVQKGDDIATVATMHGVSVGWVRLVNHLAGLRLTVGRVLYFDVE